MPADKTNRSAPKKLDAVGEAEGLWDKHPMLVIAGAVAATLSVCVMLMNEVVLPTRTASIEYKLISASQQLEVQSEKILQLEFENQNEKEAATRQVRERDARITELEMSLSRMSAEDLFVAGNPMPRGYRLISILDPVSRIQGTHPAAALESKPGWVSLRDATHSTFQRAAFYKSSEDDASAVVTHVLFHLHWSNDASAGPPQHLRLALEAALGQPEERTDGAGELELYWSNAGRWRENGVYTAVLDKTTYVVRLSQDTWDSIERLQCDVPSSGPGTPVGSLK